MVQPNVVFLNTAAAVGARICRDALWAGEECNWIGASMETIGSEWKVVHRALGPDLYSGTSGIALLLAELFGATGEGVYRKTAEACLRKAILRIDTIPASVRASLFSGAAGIGYTIVVAGDIFGDEGMVVEGTEVLQHLGHGVRSGVEMDVIGGCAGTVAALLSVHSRHASDELLDTAITFGDEILRTAKRTEFGASWSTFAMRTKHDLLGFAHGSAGIGWALLELYAATNEERFVATALDAFRYERHWFSEVEQNWPDFRDFGAGEQGPVARAVYPMAWCHGAPGVGLSRLRAYQILGDLTIRDEAMAAVRTTLNALRGSGTARLSDYSLCHGAAGWAETLLQASATMDDPDCRAAAEGIGLAGIEAYEEVRAPWPSGVSGGGETPNLMLGMAGIAHFLLRLWNPSVVSPAIITLPRANEQARSPAP